MMLLNLIPGTSNGSVKNIIEIRNNIKHSVKIVVAIKNKLKLKHSRILWERNSHWLTWISLNSISIIFLHRTPWHNYSLPKMHSSMLVLTTSCLQPYCRMISFHKMISQTFLSPSVSILVPVRKALPPLFKHCHFSFSSPLRVSIVH